MENKKIKIYAVVGPTASGKSAVALELAKRHGGEIISCDSMQVYKKMNIGTAKPSLLEMSLVKHHLIDIADPCEQFSSEDYVRTAVSAIEDCVSRGRMPIVCGGTGLYLDALLRGGNSAPAADTADIRAELNEIAEREGAEVLYERLLHIDPESAAAIHPNNLKRVIRALEIYMSCGITKSELDRQSRKNDFKYDIDAFWLSHINRETLYERINCRVDAMIEAGLIEETQMLEKAGIFKANKTAAQAIGYKELLRYLEGKESLQEATEALKTATRRYAKRQITWFCAKEYIKPLRINQEESFDSIVNNAENLFSLR